MHEVRRPRHDDAAQTAASVDPPASPSSQSDGANGRARNDHANTSAKAMPNVTPAAGTTWAATSAPAAATGPKLEISRAYTLSPRSFHGVIGPCRAH